MRVATYQMRSAEQRKERRSQLIAARQKIAAASMHHFVRHQKSQSYLAAGAFQSICTSHTYAAVSLLSSAVKQSKPGMASQLCRTAHAPVTQQTAVGQESGDSRLHAQSYLQGRQRLQRNGSPCQTSSSVRVELDDLPVCQDSVISS
jgi:hypothetical protein